MYKIVYDCDIEKVLKKIQKKDVVIILQKIQELVQDPRGYKSIKLTNRPGYRLRVGQYRVLYNIKDKELLVIIIDVDTRGDVYKKK